MQTLKIDGANAKRLFKTATPEFKQMLVDTFGEAYFSEKITDRIKTFEDACAAIGKKPSLVLSEDDTEDEAAYKKLKVIVRALNEGWEPDWNNSKEVKHYPWFYLNEPGFRLDFVYWLYTTSTVGSRLCFRSEELAKYAAEQFKEIYQAFFTN